jgi:hypothetical protein
MAIAPCLTFSATILILVQEKQKIVNQSIVLTQSRKGAKMSRFSLFNLKCFAAWPAVAAAMARQTSLRENKLKSKEFLHFMNFHAR